MGNLINILINIFDSDGFDSRRFIFERLLFYEEELITTKIVILSREVITFTKGRSRSFFAYQSGPRETKTASIRIWNAQLRFTRTRINDSKFRIATGKLPNGSFTSGSLNADRFRQVYTRALFSAAPPLITFDRLCAAVLWCLPIIKRNAHPLRKSARIVKTGSMNSIYILCRTLLI